MAQVIRKNGRIEVKFNEDRTQALVTVHPAQGGGESATASEILERLKSLGVTYGIREQAIREAIHYADDTGMAAANIVAAQGVVPQDGQDAKINYLLPLETLQKPLPKRADGSGLPDWFALEDAKLVKADQELATIVPAQPGVPGKTLTWPIQAVAPKTGKPCALSAGMNVRASDDGQHLYAATEGYVCLQGEQLVVHALKQIKETVSGGVHSFAHGAIFLESVQMAEIHTLGFAAIKGAVYGSHIRAHGDLYVRYAESCSFFVTGNIYVSEGLKDCEINTRKKVIALDKAAITGGKICATEGVVAVTLGTEDFIPTDVEVSVDRLSAIRNQEIQEELAACEANIARISQALKPFSTLAVHETLSDDKRQLLQKLQMQKRSQEARIKDLHNERRFLLIEAKEKVLSEVVVSGAIYPAVWIRIRTAAMQVEAQMDGVRFVEGSGGKSVQAEPLQKAA